MTKSTKTTEGEKVKFRTGNRQTTEGKKVGRLAVWLAMGLAGWLAAGLAGGLAA